MRILYRPVWQGVQTALRDIFIEGWPADKVIQRHLKSNRRWGSKDRKVFAEAVYDLTRWWRKLLFVSDIEWPAEDRWTDANPEIFQRVIEAWCCVREVELEADGQGLNAHEVRALWEDTSLPRAVRESVPNWLEAWGAVQLAERWDEVLKVLNQPAPIYLRVNRLKTTPEALLASLREDRVEASLCEADCIQLAQRSNVFLAKSFAAGHFEMQDRHSQRVAPELQAEKGMRVIDACAGAGGKTLHLAALMGNKGKIIALDVADKKLERLRERATRAGATSIEARLIESSKTIKRLKESADRVLLDVPCSGLGILRRNPDSKWKLNPTEVQNLRKLQGEILQSHSQMVKPGGALVYATCSISPEENSHQVEKFLSQNETRWSLEHQQTLFPAVGGGDGFYFARMRLK